MKKVASMTLIVALVAATYTASAWYLGKNVEATVNDQYSNLLESQPYIKIVARDYQRGIFESEETVTLSLFGQLPAAMSNQASPMNEESNELPALTFHSRIQHGPFPGFSTFAAAVSETELVLDDEAKAELAEVLGDKAPYSQHTVIKFDGSGTATFSSPKFDTPIPDQSGHVAWEGIEGSMDFSPGMKSFTMRMLAPKLEILEDKGSQVNFADLVFEADQQQIFEDLPYMFSGTTRFSIGSISVAGIEDQMEPVTLKQLVYDVDLPVQGDHLDIIAKMGMENLLIGEESFGPVHFDISFKHLHARTLAEINQKLMSIYSDPSLLEGDAEALTAYFQEDLMAQAETLLTNDPEFSLDRISFANPDGEARLAAHAKLSGATLEMLANPLMLLGKLEAIGDLSLSEKMIVELLRNPPFPSEASDVDLSPEEVTARGQAAVDQFQQQVAMLSEQGYLQREGQLIKTNMAFKAGQLTVNGKPFNPGAMGGQPPMQQ
ncbi:MAG: YdgA family protein [Candidatus Thiodiazotropha sp. (ex Notomyrtea botanica)]|nr:YdgA family protein [Candidatus Thiodiazotropha sp. (ex Notomyrtea botanica)]